MMYLLIYLVGGIITFIILSSRYEKDEQHLAILAALGWPILLIAA